MIAARENEEKKAFLALTIKDTGKGISADQLPQIFNRFYQVDDSATRKGEGSGIGLALVKEMVQLLDGRIEVNSEVGRGSSFTVYLPIRQHAVVEAKDFKVSSSPLSGLGPELAEVLVGAPANEQKPLILVIEDNADVAAYILSCLAPEYNLQTAPNGKAGLEKALEIIPDVILCDIMMPEMDGFEVCRQLKLARPTSHIPIILLTAKATQEDKITGLSYGADAYLTKPFNKEELLVRLSNLYRLSQRLKEGLTNPDLEVDATNIFQKQEASFLKELDQIIENNLANEDFNTLHLCRAVAMSRTQLHRKLKALTGQATANYIRSIRLQKAKTLLRETDLPIGEIASRVGFKDFSHFSKTFFSAFGVQPSVFRQQ